MQTNNLEKKFKSKEQPESKINKHWLLIWSVLIGAFFAYAGLFSWGGHWILVWLFDSLLVSFVLLIGYDSGKRNN